MTEHQIHEPQAEPDNEMVYEDYWGVDLTEKWYFPDGKQYIEFKIMDEGQKSEFQKKTSKDLVLQQKTGDARLATDPAGDRHKLLSTSVVDWYLMTKDPKTNQFYPEPFSKQQFERWLMKANPKLVEDLEFAIRMANPWLQDDMTKEQIKEEIERLEEMLRVKEREELGEGRS